jgi:hypothetical protein
MTTIQVEADSPFTARIFVNDDLVVFQPYNPYGGVPWASQIEAQAWADDLAQTNIASGMWPPLG